MFMSCGTGDFEVRSDGDVEITKRGYYYPFNFADIAGAGRGRFPANGTAQAATVMTTDNIQEKLAGGQNYKILGTDYDNYHVAYTCFDVWGFMKNEMVQVYWRDADNLSDEKKAEAKKVIDDKLPDYQGWFWQSYPISGNTFCNYPAVDKEPAFGKLKL
jgi:hypothetical protein